MFSEQLRKAMAEQEMTQAQLSSRSGLSKAAISQYLSDKNIPSIETKGKLAAALGVTIAYFDGDADETASYKEKNISVKQCARILRKSKEFVRYALQQERAPFGIAVKGSGDQWDYHISAKKLDEYIGLD